MVGSLTHCDGYRAAALARSEDVVSLGIDAEPRLELPGGVLASIALPAEQARLARLGAEQPEICWDRLLFSAKEAVYKTWFPLTRTWLDFAEADITFDLVGTFTAQLLVPGPLVDGRRLNRFDGRWQVGDKLMITAIVLPR